MTVCYAIYADFCWEFVNMDLRSLVVVFMLRDIYTLKCFTFINIIILFIPCTLK